MHQLTPGQLLAIGILVFFAFGGLSLLRKAVMDKATLLNKLDALKQHAAQVAAENAALRQQVEQLQAQAAQPQDFSDIGAGVDAVEAALAPQ